MDCCIDDIKIDLENYVMATQPEPFGEYNAVLAGFQDRAQRLCDDGMISQQVVDDFFLSGVQVFGNGLGWLNVIEQDCVIGCLALR